METEFSNTEIKDGVKNVWYWQSNGDSFHCRLFSLISKADQSNKKLLAMGFPVHVHVHRMWDEAPDQDKFFESFGLDSMTKQKAKTGR